MCRTWQPLGLQFETIWERFPEAAGVQHVASIHHNSSIDQTKKLKTSGLFNTLSIQQNIEKYLFQNLTISLTNRKTKIILKNLLSSISAALSCPVSAPPRKISGYQPLYHITSEDITGYLDISATVQRYTHEAIENFSKWAPKTIGKPSCRLKWRVIRKSTLWKLQ